MIKAVLFDLDGTLIQTEVLKACSYAQALGILTQNTVSKQQVLGVFGKYVGLSRAEVVSGLYQEFTDELEEGLDSKDPEVIQDKIITQRLSLYQDMLKDKTRLSPYFCPYSMALLQKVHADGFLAVLATMSHWEQVSGVIDMMGIRHLFHLILTRDDVGEGKPDPEIYLKAKDQLQLDATECLVIEDSVNGIKAGLHAGMRVFAVTNDVTRSSVHAGKLLPKEFVVDDLEELSDRVYRFLGFQE